MKRMIISSGSSNQEIKLIDFTNKVHADSSEIEGKYYTSLDTQQGHQLKVYRIPADKFKKDWTGLEGIDGLVISNIWLTTYDSSRDVAKEIRSGHSFIEDSRKYDKLVSADTNPNVYEVLVNNGFEFICAVRSNGYVASLAKIL